MVEGRKLTGARWEVGWLPSAARRGFDQFPRVLDRFLEAFVGLDQGESEVEGI